jgi:hypothetical protein
MNKKVFLILSSDGQTYRLFLLTIIVALITNIKGLYLCSLRQKIETVKKFDQLMTVTEKLFLFVTAAWNK